MNIARLSLKRPIFISCIVIIMIVLGLISLGRIGVDLFPPIDFPVVTVSTLYPGATPTEIEELITKPIEEQVSSIAGIERLSSRNNEGMSVVIAEFDYETDIQYAEEKMREKVALARNNLPADLLDEPVVRQFDFTDMPILTFALVADIKPAELYDLAKEELKPIIEQVSGVGEVRISGGTRREIQVELDRNRLNEYEISTSTVVNRLSNSGANVPIGKHDSNGRSTLFRTVGQFTDLDQIRKAVVSFGGDVNSSVTVDRIGRVVDGTEDLNTISYIYYPFTAGNTSAADEQAGSKNRIDRATRPCLLIDVFKQSGGNTVAVSDGVMERLGRINQVLSKGKGNPQLIFVYDTAKHIRRNIDDVFETMIIGIILAIFVVYLFLGNVRSTIITSIAIPNSLLGAFVLMYFMGFTLNIMTLLALSLTIGLLVDDAIVVRENIFRKLEGGCGSMRAAEIGTTEVMLAVIATTLTIIAVFFPIAFLEGVIGRFFKQFGLTIVFAISISLFDALTVAPLLSGYFAGSGKKDNNFVVKSFERLQSFLERGYGSVIRFSLNHPLFIILITLAVFIGSVYAFGTVKKTFQPDPDEGEFLINLQLPPDTSLNGSYETALKIAEELKSLPELDFFTLQAGNDQGQANVASIGMFAVPREERKRDTAEIKQELRKILAKYSYAKPAVDNYSRVAGGGSNKPYVLIIKGENLDVLNEYAEKVIEKLRTIPDLTEVTTSFEPGKPEFQVHLDPRRLEEVGVSQRLAGLELRYQIEGGLAGKYHSGGLEYDIRVRLKPEQRNLKSAFENTKIPNIQNRMIPLNAVAEGISTEGPARILRQERARIVQVMANIAPDGALGNALSRTHQIVNEELPLPEGVSYSFIGQADSFQDMVKNIIMAFFLSILFIYLVLASLYESFITPVTILIALPPALSGAFYAFIVTGKMMDMFGMIGIIMLLGIVTKNSILLVDFALEGIRTGMTRKEAIYNAGLIRLRPILMTTLSMLAGTLPVALGIGAAAKYRTGMGVAVIGGLIISTLITLIMVPAAFEYIDRFREFIEKRFRPAADNMLCEEDMTRERIIREEFAEKERAKSSQEVLEKTVRKRKRKRPDDRA